LVPILIISIFICMGAFISIAICILSGASN